MQQSAGSNYSGGRGFRAAARNSLVRFVRAWISFTTCFSELARENNRQYVRPLCMFLPQKIRDG